VAIASTIPAGGIARTGYTVEGEPTAAWKLRLAAFATVYGDYFRAMGIALRDGRYFTENDRSSALPVIVINQSMAKHCWPGQRPIGKHLHLGSPQKQLPWATVVGVVADTKTGARDESSEDQFYTPAQQPATLYGSDYSGKLTDPAGGYLIMRSTLPPEGMVQTLRSTVREVDPLLALEHVQTMNDAISNVEAPRRFNTDLITAFAAGALLFAIIGIHAVIAFSVSLRSREIAVRIALGAQRSAIATLVLISGLKLALIGCGLGVLSALAASGLMSSFVFGISATDPLIYSASVLMMMVLAVLASALPAARAAIAEPMAVLRSS
jgi:putative ABC transport system permease protein